MTTEMALPDLSNVALHLSEGVDAEREARFERVARLAARGLRAPVAQVNVVRPDRQVSLCSIGPTGWAGAREVPIESSICQHVVRTREPLVIADAGQHPGSVESATAVRLGIAAYLAVPVVHPDGHAFGSLCVVDFTPRRWEAEDVSFLEDLVESVLLEADRHAATRLDLLEREGMYRTLFEQSPVGIFTFDRDLRVTAVNPRVLRGLRIPPELASDIDLSRMPNQELLHALRAALAGEQAAYDGPYQSGISGVQVTVSLRASPLRNARGEVTGGIAMVEDVTEWNATQEEARAAKLEIVERLAQAAEFRDEDTGQHTRRVGELSAAIGRTMGMVEGEVELLRRAAPLHDVGKIAIPDHILLKPGRLTTEEYEVMKTHTVTGAQLLSAGGTDLIRMAEVVARSHHERWDGAGYPDGLRGEEIPLVARIVALADFYDALTSDRPYRAAHSREETLAEIHRGIGAHFDPRVVQAFLEYLPVLTDRGG